MNKVDILLPVYNGEEYIVSAIESVISQTYPHWKLYVIDDGSTDNTKELVNKLVKKDSRIIYIKKENSGLIDTLNYGLKRCRSKYIARMDHDDIMLPTRIRNQVDFLSRFKEVDVVGSQVDLIDENNNLIGKYNMPITLIKFFPICFYRTPLIHPSVMFRNSVKVRKELYYDNSSKGCEDFNLWLRLLNKGYNLSNLKTVELKYRVHKGSISNSGDKIVEINAANELLKVIKVHGIKLNDKEENSFIKVRSKIKAKSLLYLTIYYISFLFKLSSLNIKQNNTYMIFYCLKLYVRYLVRSKNE